MPPGWSTAASLSAIRVGAVPDPFWDGRSTATLGLEARQILPRRDATSGLPVDEHREHLVVEVEEKSLTRRCFHGRLTMAWVIRRTVRGRRMIISASSQARAIRRSRATTSLNSPISSALAASIG